MKKIIFLIAISFCFSSLVPAQTNSGIYVGTVLTKLKASSPGNPNLPTRDYYGTILKFPVEYEFGKMLSLEGGPILYFGNAGFSEQNDNYPYHYSGNYDYKIQVLELPLTLKLKFGVENVNFYTSLGLAVGIPVDGKVQAYGSHNLFGGVTYFDEDRELQSFSTDYSLSELQSGKFPIASAMVDAVMGGGVSIGVGRFEIRVEGLYWHGMTDWMPDGDWVESNQKITVKSKRYSLTAGIAFPLGALKSGR